MVLNDDKFFKTIKSIDRYLKKKNYHKYMTMFLDGYNNNHIYINFCYADDIKAYRLVWFDLNFINVKHLDRYISEQIMTSFSANKLIENLRKIDYKSDEVLNDNILGDRVYIKLFLDGEKSYVFDRFLPKKWSKFIDPFILAFSYLPRGMDLFLNEMFAIFDKAEEQYNSRKAIKLDVFKDKFEKHFGDLARDKGTKLYANGRVTFLEKINDKYIAIVDDIEPRLVIVDQINNDFTALWCTCNKAHYCEHIFAALLALRNKTFNNFYKVRYKGDNFTLLDMVRDGLIYFCFGIDGDNLLLVSDNEGIVAAPIVENGKCMFEVIEDDDDCSLSKYLEQFDK